MRDVDCDRVRGFYRGGEHHSMGMDEEEEEDGYDFDWSQHPFAPWAEDYDYGGYPGTRGCETTCEGYNFTSRETWDRRAVFLRMEHGKVLVCGRRRGLPRCHQIDQMLADMGVGRRPSERADELSRSLAHETPPCVRLRRVRVRERRAHVRG